MAVGFAVCVFWLNARQYATFHNRAADLAMFDQSIWNTLQGRFMFSTIKNRSILANHFSPYMALLAPLFLVWSDVRVLYLFQAIGLAIAGLLLYKIVQEKYPKLAPWFLLAFFLNPALHEVALLELRRVILAVPFLALAMYGLATGQRRKLAIGLFLALLCKENIGLIVFVVGLYLLLFERDWKWGGALMVLGAAWVVSMMLWVIPAFNPPDDPSAYRLYGYFSDWGDSLGGIASALLREPMEVLRWTFDAKAFKALWRVFMPLGLLLPFLAPEWLAMSFPSLFYMLMSSRPDMHKLEDWYMASVLPILFAAIGVGLTRRSERQARWLTGVLLVATLIGFFQFSIAPGGGRYDPAFFTLTDRADLANQVVSAIPPEARVAAQDPYVVHLSHREHIYFYPWIPDAEKEKVEYYIFDRQAKAYPFNPDEINWEIDNMVADPSLVVQMEGDGIFLLQRDADPLPSFAVEKVAEGAIKLEKAEVAIANGDGFFRPIDQAPAELVPGHNVRVSLYWDAIDQPAGERTVSVRIIDATGALVAQHDMQPSKGARPTTWWQPGWYFRDIYYLTIPDTVTPGPASLELLLYDSYTAEWVPFDDGQATIKLCDLTLQTE